MSLINNLEELALATRLKRLSERLSSDVSKIYKESDIDFEAKWYLILELLERNKLMSVTEIADALKLSHPAIVQFITQLEKKKLIKTQSDKNDGRKRMVSLSAGGRKTLEKLKPVLAIIKEENKNWLKETESNLLKVLDDLEKSLDEKSMYERVKMSLLKNRINI